MKTEKHKMISGEMYNALDDQLSKERLECKIKCYDYNHTKPGESIKKSEILSVLLGKCKQITIEQNFWCDYGYNIEIGDNFFSNYNLVILDCAKVTFGDNVFIGPNCSFYTAGHPINPEIRNQGLEDAHPIFVGNNVWFGGSVTVLPGVTIGDNTTIGAGSVVTKDIPANVVAVGNPCKVIKEITDGY